MKTALKKSFVLIGIALFFVLTAWAEQKIWAWDKNVPEKELPVMPCKREPGESVSRIYKNIPVMD